MEYLGWDCSPNVSSWWTNQQCEIGHLSDSNCCSYKTEDDILNPSQQLMIHKRTSAGDDYPINSEKLVSQMVQHLAVPPPDSIIVASTTSYSWQHEQRQLEAISLASANNMILVSESGAACASWESEADLCNSNSPNSIKMKPDFGIMPQDIKAAAVLSAITTCTASMDSLDCLLSATNSNTDTTISSAHQDDVINSILFSQSHCKNSVLSGDSGNDDHHKHLHQEIYRPNSSSYTAKRSNNNIDHCQFFQGGSEYCSNKGGGFNFQLISGNDHPPEAKKARLLENKRPSSSNINFQEPSSCNSSPNYVDDQEPDSEAIVQMKEMIYRAAAFRPVNLVEEEVVEKPRRKNVKVSSDPQTVAARQRRERISEKIRVLQRMVPGGTKMDTASMLDEAANYLKFLRSQVKALDTLGQGHNNKLDSFVMNSSSFSFNHSFPMQTPLFSLP